MTTAQPTDRKPPSRRRMTDAEGVVRAMSKPERRAFLLARGWRRIGQSWRHPSCDQADGDTGFYTLAVAIRAAIAAVLAEDTPCE